MLDSIMKRFVYFCRMESTRQLKVAALLKTELGEFFQRHTTDVIGRYVMITITKVYITKDLSQAKVYLSIFGVENKSDILKLIKGSTKFVKKFLAEKIRHQVRVVPEPFFFLDDSLDYIEHLDELLQNE